MHEEYKDKTLLERIALMRAHFAKIKMEPTGKGKASDNRGDRDFDFLQLEDFLPKALVMCEEMGLCPVESIVGNVARMVVMDVKGEYDPVTFELPTCKVETFKGQELQGIGSQSSYSRRYLWNLLLENSVHDELDEGKWNNVGKSQDKKASKAQQQAAKGSPQQTQEPPKAQRNPKADAARLDAVTSASQDMSREELLSTLSSLGYNEEKLVRGFGNKELEYISDNELRFVLGKVAEKMKGTVVSKTA